jgi:acyl-CoA synthetase (NDP forming)
MRMPSLDRLLRPRSIALVGASEQSNWSRRIVENLRLHEFPGPVHMVNPRRSTVFGQTSYPSLLAVPGEVDMAFVMVATEAAAQVARDCAAKGVGGAVMLTSGFAEVGPAGAELQEEVAGILRAGDVALSGPNCLGYVNPPDRVAAYTLALSEPVPAGGIGMVLQSGALLSPVLRYATKRGIGLRLLVSSGNEAMLDATDYLAYMVEDPAVRVLGALLEAIRRPEAFAALCARAHELGKPVVVLKVGDSEVGRRVALAHTGAMAGSARFTDVFLRRCGVVRSDTLEELIEVLGLLAAHGRPPSRRVVVVAASGGICGIASDLGSRLGLEFPALQPETVAALREVLPPFATPQNPLDVTGFGAVRPNLYNDAMEVVCRDPGAEVVLAVTTLPEAPGPDPAVQERRLAGTAELGRRAGKYLVLTGYTASEPTAYGRELLQRHGLHFAGGVAAALRAIRATAEVPGPVPRRSAPARVPDVPLHGGAWSEVESKRLLQAAGVPVPRETLAGSLQEAAAAAAEIGYPVVLKVVSPDVAHKTEAGAVATGIADAAALAAAYDRILASAAAYRPGARIEGVLVAEQVGGGIEMLAGIQRDPQYGPGVLVGFGGIFAEVLEDSSLRIAPLDEQEALAMLRELRGWPLLDGARGRPRADVRALVGALLALSDLALGLGPRLLALDVNPLLVRTEGGGVVALDALVEMAE